MASKKKKKVVVKKKKVATGRSRSAVSRQRDKETLAKIDGLATTVVKSGLQPGESIALEGLLRLRDGMTVIAKPTQLDDSGSRIEGGA